MKYVPHFTVKSGMDYYMISKIWLARNFVVNKKIT
jgi:hypothetical protein